MNESSEYSLAAGPHPFVTTQVRELCVSLEADLALEGLDAAVDVSVLLQSAQRRERLDAGRADVRARSRVNRPDVLLQMISAAELQVAVLARVLRPHLLPQLLSTQENND